MAHRWDSQEDAVACALASFKGRLAIVHRFAEFPYIGLLASHFDEVCISDDDNLASPDISAYANCNFTQKLERKETDFHADLLLLVCFSATEGFLKTLESFIRRLKPDGKLAILSRSQTALNASQQNYLDLENLLAVKKGVAVGSAGITSEIKKAGFKNVREIQASYDPSLADKTFLERFKGLCLQRLLSFSGNESLSNEALESLRQQIVSAGIQPTGFILSHGTMNQQTKRKPESLQRDIALLLGIDPDNPQYRALLSQLADRESTSLYSQEAVENLALRYDLNPSLRNHLFAFSRSIEFFSAGTTSVLHEMNASVADLTEQLRRKTREEIHALYLTDTDRVVYSLKLAEGSEVCAELNIIEALRPAILNRLKRIILLHNHPSGIASPSVEDLHITRRLSSAASLFGIQLVNHIIIGSAGTASAQ